MITVRATREGLPGQKTSSGYRIDGVVRFVALPALAALRQWVRVFNPANGKSCVALVLDVGPWNENDNVYVFQEATNPNLPYAGLTPRTPDGLSVDITKAITLGIRPQAETGKDTFGRPTNGAGIDLGEAVWQALEMKDNAPVSWEFL